MISYVVPHEITSKASDLTTLSHLAFQETVKLRCFAVKECLHYYIFKFARADDEPYVWGYMIGYRMTVDQTDKRGPLSYTNVHETYQKYGRFGKVSSFSTDGK